jgi:hypothetical protein
MRRMTSAFLLLTLWLGACTSNPASTPSDSTEPAKTEAAGESTPTEISTQVLAQREAVIAEIENEVTVRIEADGEFIPAEAGAIIQQGGALQTGADGRARLDLKPEGTIVRVAPNSVFNLSEVANAEGKPQTTLSLIFGKIFVLLNGGSLDVQTPSGVASVRGSLLSVSYDPTTGKVQAVCLEGHCAIENESGDEADIPEGDSALVDENGDIVEFDGIDQGEIQAWLNENPELGEFLDELPNPESYPELEGFELFDFDPSQYFEENSDGGIEFFEGGPLPDLGPGDGDIGPDGVGPDGDGPGGDPGGAGPGGGGPGGGG